MRVPLHPEVTRERALLILVFLAWHQEPISSQGLNSCGILEALTKILQDSQHEMLAHAGPATAGHIKLLRLAAEAMAGLSRAEAGCEHIIAAGLLPTLIDLLLPRDALVYRCDHGIGDASGQTTTAADVPAVPSASVAAESSPDSAPVAAPTPAAGSCISISVSCKARFGPTDGHQASLL